MKFKQTPKIFSGPQEPQELKFKERNLGELFYNAFEKHSNRIAQIDAASSAKETYSSFLLRARKAAISFRFRSISKSDSIAILSNYPLDTLVPIFGALFIGAKISHFDVSQTAEQIRNGLRALKPKIIFVESAALALMEDSLKGCEFDSEIVELGVKISKYTPFCDFIEQGQDGHDFDVPDCQVSADETAFVLFTSGTTGLAKPICHSQYSIMLQLSQHYNGTTDTSLLAMRFFWISPLTFCLKTIIAGGYIVYPKVPINAESICHAIETYKVSQIISLPQSTYDLTNYTDAKSHDLSSLRAFVFTGGLISKYQVARLRSIFRNAIFLNQYGSTEAGPINEPLSSYNFETKDEGFCGKLTASVKLKIVDLESGDILNNGEIGEIYVKSSYLMSGYMNIDNSKYFDNDGFFKMGDLGYVDDDDNLYVLERISDVVKTDTCYFINPAVVEDVLVQHPAVKEAAVFSVAKGELKTFLTACVVLNQDFDVRIEEIEIFADQRLVQNEKLTGGIYIVDSLPKTATGKVIRRKVKEDFVKSRGYLGKL